MSISVLDRELYDVNLAAQVLRMPASTLQWWLEGGRRQGKLYEPVIREEATGSKSVTWGELVEARYLLGYRRDLRVRLSELRKWITATREELQVPYPLAHQRPWVGEERRILTDAQRSTGLPEELWAMWVAESGQILLTPPAESFLERVDFEDDEAVRIHPVGRESPVVIDPQIRFGMATVHGIPTEAIAEQVQGGDPIEMVASDFDLNLKEVVAVLSYELVQTSVAA
jgi:uncharacterized protein (DUF433 family)